MKQTQKKGKTQKGKHTHTHKKQKKYERTQKHENNKKKERFFCEHYLPEAITPMGKMRLSSLENSVHGVARGYHTTAISELSYFSAP